MIVFLLDDPVLRRALTCLVTPAAVKAIFVDSSPPLVTPWPTFVRETQIACAV